MRVIEENLENIPHIGSGAAMIKKMYTYFSLGVFFN